MHSTHKLHGKLVSRRKRRKCYSNSNLWKSSLFQFRENAHFVRRAQRVALRDDLKQLLAELQHGLDALLPGLLKQGCVLRVAFQGRFH